MEQNQEENGCGCWRRLIGWGDTFCLISQNVLRAPGGREEEGAGASKQGGWVVSSRTQKYKTRSVSWTASISLCGWSRGRRGGSKRWSWRNSQWARPPRALCSSQFTWTLSHGEALNGLKQEGRQSLPHGTVEKGLEDGTRRLVKNRSPSKKQYGPSKSLAAEV